MRIVKFMSSVIRDNPGRCSRWSVGAPNDPWFYILELVDRYRLKPGE